MTNPVVQKLTNLTVLDPAGEEVPMASLWQDRPVLLALIRHFG